MFCFIFLKFYFEKLFVVPVLG